MCSEPPAAAVPGVEKIPAPTMPPTTMAVRAVRDIVCSFAIVLPQLGNNFAQVPLRLLVDAFGWRGVTFGSAAVVGVTDVEFLSHPDGLIEYGVDLRRDLAEAIRDPDGLIRAWLAAHRGPDADAVMDHDPRYAYFTVRPDDGIQPVGAAGVPLPPGRALAVDPTQHRLGELFWIDASAPALSGWDPVARPFIRVAYDAAQLLQLRRDGLGAGL